MISLVLYLYYVEQYEILMLDLPDLVVRELRNDT